MHTLFVQYLLCIYASLILKNSPQFFTFPYDEKKLNVQSFTVIFKLLNFTDKHLFVFSDNQALY